MSLFRTLAISLLILGIAEVFGKDVGQHKTSKQKSLVASEKLAGRHTTKVERRLRKPPDSENKATIESGRNIRGKAQRQRPTDKTKERQRHAGEARDKPRSSKQAGAKVQQVKDRVQERRRVGDRSRAGSSARQ